MPRLHHPKIDPAKVHEARGDAGLTQEALARRIRCATITVQGWERGRNNPRPRMLAKLARATGKPVEFFLTDEAA